MTSDELEGRMNGAAEDTIGKAKETVSRTARRAKAAVSDAADQVADTYGSLRDTAQSVAVAVDPLVREKPYFALALAACAGFIAGALIFGGGAKVIYIRPARE